MGEGGKKLKDFFYLPLNQLSTMQEIIKGDKKERETGLRRMRGASGGEREGAGKHYSSAPSKHETLGYFNSGPRAENEGQDHRMRRKAHRKIMEIAPQLNVKMEHSQSCLN